MMGDEEGDDAEVAVDDLEGDDAEAELPAVIGEPEVAVADDIRFEDKDKDSKEGDEIDEATELKKVADPKGGDDDNTKSPVNAGGGASAKTTHGTPVKLGGDANEKGGTVAAPKDMGNPKQEAKLSAVAKPKAGVSDNTKSPVAAK